jgi:uroporphyrinogen-III synthase
MRIVSLESRRGGDLASLLRRHGGEPIEAPSMAERPLADQAEALAFGERLMAGECDGLVLLTGVGLESLVDALTTRWPREAVLAALGRTALLCRGPKPVAAIKREGLQPAAVAPEPNTWRELLSAIDAWRSVAGLRLFVQEYGERNENLLQGLRERGATVQPVPIYAWTLPDDTAPLEAAIRALCDGGADAVLFTSGQQLRNLVEIATRLGLLAELNAAFSSRVLVASIGPLTTQTLLAAGLPVDLEPERPKMGPLAIAVTGRGPQLLAAKRARQS